MIPDGRLCWLDKSHTPKGSQCSRETLEMLRIEQGYPWFGVDISEENLPQEVNRNQQAISFTKGCYLGQETVARIDALGHVNRMLCGVAFSGNEMPDAGLQLNSGDKVAGQVTSAAWSPKLGHPLALAYLRRGSEAPGTTLSSVSGDGTVMAIPI
jgi:folate-binding protein YgfZ